MVVGLVNQRTARGRRKRGVDPRLLTALGVAILGCGARQAGTPPGPATTPFAVDPLQCPELQRSSAGKISHEGYLRAHPELTHSITVRLRELPWDPPACAGDKSDTAQCPARDQALQERQALNVMQVSCVSKAFGPEGSLKAPRAYWYEPLRLRIGGTPAPIGTSFSALALWSQIEVVARHPYVERIEPALGEAAKLGVAPPAVPSECPVADEVPAPKLMEASIQGLGRQPVVIELREQLLASLWPCAGGDTCDELFASGWARTIVGRRMLTCVRTWLETKLEGVASDVAYQRADGIPLGPSLPPFGDGIHATLAFGLGLTWTEVTEVAKHPLVESVWTSPALSLGVLPPGCPPNYDVPVEPPECPKGTEAIDGKFTAESRSMWEASKGPNEVVIAVRRRTEVCPRPACPGRQIACPELQRYSDRLTQEATALQTCVRALIAFVGGSATPEVLVAPNAMIAMLTWAQIQAVAADPQVADISPRFIPIAPP